MGRRSAEHILQQQVADYLRLAMSPGSNWCSIDHAGTNARHGAMLRARGVKEGCPDIHITLPGGRCGWLELKTPRGKLSPAQKAFHAAEMDAGALVAICRSLEEVEHVLRAWGVQLRASVRRVAA